MQKIALVLPQSDMNDGVARRMASQTLCEVSLHLISHDSLDETMDLILKEGCSVVVSRSCYIVQIREKYQIPTVEIMITSNEMNNLISRACIMSRKKFPYISIIDFSSAVYDLELFEKKHSAQIVRHRVRTEAEVAAVVTQNSIEGVDVIIGGDTVSLQSLPRKIPCLSLTSSEDSLREALRVAESVSAAIAAQREHIAQLETLLDYSFNGIIRIDTEGKIVICNRAAESFSINASNLPGTKLQTLVPGITDQLLSEVLENGKEIYSAIFELGKESIIANLAPIISGPRIIGAIFSWHEVKKIRRYESQIRRDLYPLGYVAEYRFSMLEGCSKELEKRISAAKRYAFSDSPVLISGNTGTEKEILAQCIHNASTRSRFPYVAVDPASQTDESQAAFLFGYSGTNDRLLKDTAADAQNGLLAQAHGGTVFFREISALTQQSQQLLLRLLQNKTISYTGSERPLPVDIRVIASTKRNLPELVAQGKFNKALYYYLNRLFIHLPPLSDRKTDVQFWLKQYLKRYSKLYQKYITLTQGAETLIMNYPWEGNLIQLDSFCEQLTISTPKLRINEHQVAEILNEMYAPHSDAGNPTAASPQVVMTSEQQQIEETLMKYYGNRTLAANELGISTSTLWRKLKKYNILS